MDCHSPHQIFLPRDRPGSTAVQAGSLPTELAGSPEGVGGPWLSSFILIKQCHLLADHRKIPCWLPIIICTNLRLMLLLLLSLLDIVRIYFFIKWFSDDPQCYFKSRGEQHVLKIIHLLFVRGMAVQIFKSLNCVKRQKLTPARF